MARSILDIAANLKSLYEKVYNLSDEESDLTEMKMHKLLYFAQKRHYANFGKWLFDDDFEGWVHGPVNIVVRQSMYLLDNLQEELTLDEEYTIREVVYDFGKYSAGALRNLSHKDLCYQKSREGLSEYETGNKVIEKEDIIKDIPSSLYNNDDCYELEVK